MREQPSSPLHLAIDIGASSGRHILGRVEEGRLVMEEMHRFENRQLRKNGHDCWDMDNLWQGILEGLRACGRAGKIPATIGIDTWGVDFVLLDGEDNLLGDPVAYRDSRTQGVDVGVEALVSPQELYARTGIQKQSYNTIYQLWALKAEHPEQLEQAQSLLMVPDYFNFLLTGEKRQEYTEATTSGLVNAAGRCWDLELIRRLGLPEGLFGELSPPGTVVGRLRPEIQDTVGFDAAVMLPASHDTGSAFLAVPARDGQAVYLSSGTWSLLGVESPGPVTTEESRQANFTNEGGAWYRFRYLKNIMGLWMIQSIRRELNGTSYVAGRGQLTESARQWSFPELAEEARKAEGFTARVDVDDERFLAPDSMIEAVKGYCQDTAQPVPRTVGQLMQTVYQSLARCYAQAIESLSRLTGQSYTSVNIVGGGCQDSYLNELTAKATGLPVLAGPVEGTAIGNLLAQMVFSGEFASLREARDSVKNSFTIKEVKP